mmetsp:Transcript_93240/g.268492  ORF Transcript_93240/g.268492 Transcript_93240/m.268492 type:complete len:211 (-) Transcript_93240:22-654(-)
MQTRRRPRRPHPVRERSRLEVPLVALGPQRALQAVVERAPQAGQSLPRGPCQRRLFAAQGRQRTLHEVDSVTMLLGVDLHPQPGNWQCTFSPSARPSLRVLDEEAVGLQENGGRRKPRGVILLALDGLVGVGSVGRQIALVHGVHGAHRAAVFRGLRRGPAAAWRPGASRAAAGASPDPADGRRLASRLRRRYNHRHGPWRERAWRRGRN